ncbi:TonB-dependent receptor [Lacinutrix undariae]
MQKHIKHIFSVVTLLSVSVVCAQDRTTENDTLDTQVVNIVKAYTPTISDAFKIKETPTLNDENTGVKKEVKYNIFSIPVASTFTPAKGKAATVDKAKAIKLYDNYASLGFGTYTSILGEVYLNHELSRSETIGGYLSHHSSQGGIKDLLLDDDFSKTNLNVNYRKQLRDLSWKIDGGFELNSFNWYGLPQPYYDASTVGESDVKHSFYSGYVGGRVDFDDAILSNASLKFRHFGDDRSSGENRFVVGTEFEIPVQDQKVSTQVGIDYLGGSFDKGFYVDETINYGNISASIAPSYQLIQDELTVNLGVEFVYFNDTEAGDSKFYVYPNINASYRLVDELLIAYGAVEGGLSQNSYYDYSTVNPFVSPTLFITPTDQQYNASLGIKGKLSNSMSYNVSGHYYAENNKGLFSANSIAMTPTEAYHYGNSFGIVYDKVTTVSFGGELQVDINRNFKLGVKGEYFNYSTDEAEEAWNLPNLKASVFADYQIDENWFAGASIFYVGERKDQFKIDGGIIPVEPQTITLDAYFDANAHVGYKVNDRLSVYAKANNIAGENYQRWLNYPVQGIQFLAGATYQFDF